MTALLYLLMFIMCIFTAVNICMFIVGLTVSPNLDDYTRLYKNAYVSIIITFVLVFILNYFGL